MNRLRRWTGSRAPSSALRRVLPSLVSALLWAGLCGPAAAQKDCPDAADLTPHMLQGIWRVSWTDGLRERGHAPWTLELGPHPDYPDSLKGQLAQGNARLAVVGDWDEETLTLEESADGQRISATWQARAVPGQCGRALAGLRFSGSEADASARRFRMQRVDSPSLGR